MVQQITAYLSSDGQIYRDIDDADYADYMAEVGASIDAFLGAKGRPDDKALLQRWELARVGGKTGWLASRLPMDAPLPVPAALPLDLQQVTGPPAKKTARAAKATTAIAQALEAARETRLAQAGDDGTKYRKHVGVVGLFQMHHESISREFGKVLKLSIYDSDCVAKLHGLKACHKVVVMTKFVSHKHVETLKAIGQEPLLVHGGLDKLKDALTNIYVNS